MIENYGIEIVDSNKLGNGILWSDYPTKRVNVAIGVSGILKRGCVLGQLTADSKYYPFDSAATDGTEEIAGILGEDIDTTTSEGIGWMYVEGEFYRPALSAATDSVIPLGSVNYGAITIKEEC